MKLSELARHKQPLVTTEFMPPRGIGLQDLKQKILSVADVIDAVNIPELKAAANGSFPYRMSPFHASLRIKEITGIETVFHLTPRDVNRSAIHGTLLAAAEANNMNVLIVSGDRYSPNEETTLSRNVYDVRTTPELIRIVKSVEREFSCSFCVVVGADPTVLYGEDGTERTHVEIHRLLERQDAGAELVQTQPVFDRRFLDFVDAAKSQGLKMPVLAGLIPLKGRRDCLELEKRFGITIPQETKNQMSAGDSGLGTKIVNEVCRELVEQGAAGIHIYPRERPEYIREILKGVRRS